MSNPFIINNHFIKFNNYMNKIFLILAAAMIMSNYCKAQDGNTDQREVPHFGVRIGANFSNVYDTKGDNFKADNKIGFVFGGFLSVPVSKYIGIQPEVLYSQKGYKTSGSVLGLNYDYTHTSYYLDIPILLAFKPIPVLSIQIGPQYSYLMKQKNEFNSSLLSGQNESDYDNSNVRKNTLCLLGGVELNINHFIVSARAGWDLQNNNGDGTSTFPRYKNVWYQTTIGILF